MLCVADKTRGRENVRQTALLFFGGAVKAFRVGIFFRKHPKSQLPCFVGRILRRKCNYQDTNEKGSLFRLPSRAENETRTRDPNLGKVVLYQLSYFRINASAKIVKKNNDPKK